MNPEEIVLVYLIIGFFSTVVNKFCGVFEDFEEVVWSLKPELWALIYFPRTLTQWCFSILASIFLFLVAVVAWPMVILLGIGFAIFLGIRKEREALNFDSFFMDEVFRLYDQRRPPQERQ